MLKPGFNMLKLGFNTEFGTDPLALPVALAVALPLALALAPWQTVFSAVHS